MSDMPDSNITFDQFGLTPNILQGVNDAGFKQPSPIQIEAIPHILAGRDLIGQAHTGTGKTAAFGLPAMSRIDGNRGVEILIITPTRELATQVSDEMFRLGRFAGIQTTTIYGGQSYARQIERIKRGVQVVVATPGRLLDMLTSDRIGEFKPSIVILDEADEMLDMGFLDDIQEIFKYLPDERQTLLFSATMPPPIRKLAETILKDPATVFITKKDTTNKDIEQRFYIIEEHERDDAMIRMIDGYEPTKSIIFCRTKKEVERLATILIGRGYSAKGLHGDMEQPQREEVIKAFRSGKIYTLIATDVAARGLDVADVTHVFNYHLPFDPESYVHRIGRTGRAGKKGMAITLVTPMEYRGMMRIKRVVGGEIKQDQIPSISEVRSQQVDNLFDELRDQPDSEAAATLMARMTEIDLNPEEIAMRAISLLMDKQTITGPENIGVHGARLKRLMDSYQKEQTDRKEGRGTSRNRFQGKGSYRGGGRGGERGGRGESRGEGRGEGRGDRPDRPRGEGRGDRPDRPRSEGRGDRPDRPRSEGRGDRPDRPRSEGRGEYRGGSSEGRGRGEYRGGEGRTERGDRKPSFTPGKRYGGKKDEGKD